MSQTQIGIIVTISLAVAITVLALIPVSLDGDLIQSRLQHALAFAALAFPLTFVRPVLFAPVVSAVIIYGGAIEIIQPFLGRDASWMDFLVNIIGAASGGVLGALSGKIKRKKRVLIGYLIISVLTLVLIYQSQKQDISTNMLGYDMQAQIQNRMPYKDTDESEFPSVGLIRSYSQEEIEAGELAFGVCKTCHKIGDAASHGVGPQLNAVYGSIAGSKSGFVYSKMLTEAGKNGLIWSNATLHKYLADPRGHISQTRMYFTWIPEYQVRHAVIAYLSNFTEQ